MKNVFRKAANAYNFRLSLHVEREGIQFSLQDEQHASYLKELRINSV